MQSIHWVQPIQARLRNRFPETSNHRDYILLSRYLSPLRLFFFSPYWVSHIPVLEFLIFIAVWEAILYARCELLHLVILPTRVHNMYVQGYYSLPFLVPSASEKFITRFIYPLRFNIASEIPRYLSRLSIHVEIQYFPKASIRTKLHLKVITRTPAVNNTNLMVFDIHSLSFAWYFNIKGVLFIEITCDITKISNIPIQSIHRILA
jgi:hypothetical protein